MKRGKIKILLLALTMILGTFAAGFTDYPGNDSYSFKVDPPESMIFYFDEDGEESEEPTDIWVEFTLSEDEIYLSFETNNLDLELISIKGSNGYRVYDDPGSSGSGLTAPTDFEKDGVTVKYFQISHYSFELDRIIPPPDDEGEIDITKIVIDGEEDVITDDETEFHFKIEISDGDGGWDEIDESPITITGNDTETIDGLPMGVYKITEYDIDEEYELVGDDDYVIVELEEDGDEVKAEFTNMKEGEPPSELGSLKVHKRIMRENGNVDANLGDGEFTVRLTGPDGYDEELTIQKPGEYVIFTDLPFGTYTLEETEAYDPEIEFGDYYFANSGNQNHTEISDEVEIDSENEVEVWLDRKSVV